MSVDLYESRRLEGVLGKSLHPGGLKLTERAARIAQLNEGSKVLDIGCGSGISDLFLACKYGCNVTGIDPSKMSLPKIGGKKVQFLRANAERLPFDSEVFDVVLSECSFSPIPKKDRAARGIWRVLKSGGKFLFHDIFLKEGDGGDSPIPCIRGAMTRIGYLRLLEDAGFQEDRFEDHSSELKAVCYKIQANPELSFLLSRAETRRIKIGYGLISAVKRG
jgi:ubiquinone/menaquinone biosynthesis C-methylase UbiE